MTNCKQCAIPAAREPITNTLYLAPALGHTSSKAQLAVQELPDATAKPLDGILAITIGHGRLDGVLASLKKHLSSTELESCRAVLVPENETFGLQHLAQMQSLASLGARIDAEWLVELLRDDRLLMHFQPIVPIAEPTTVFAYECLLRGVDTHGALIPPNRLFGAARDAELLFQLDKSARLTAIRDRATHGIPTPIFINFNPTSIYDPAFCLRTTIRAIHESGVTPDRIVFEVVESDRVGDMKHLLTIFEHYRKEGFRVALDDLGAGYASLNLLAQLRPDFVKFDRDLVTDIHRDPYKRKIFTKLLEMARDLEIATIAEGLETVDDFDFIRDAGTDYAQGYLFAKPASPPPHPQPLPARRDSAAFATD